MQYPLATILAAFAGPALPQAEPAAEQEAGEESTEPERGLRVREAGALDGYTLISPLLSDKTYLLDMDGEIAHEWQTEYAPCSTYLLESGNLLRGARQDDNPRFHGGGIGGRILEYDWDGAVVWEFELANEYQTYHHDFALLPNGNVLVIAWEYLPPEEALALGRDPAVVGGEGLWTDAVLEIRPTRPIGGEVVWEWHAWDHMIQDFDPEGANHDSIPDHPELIDINADHRDQPPKTKEELERIAEIERQMRATGYAGGEDNDDEDETADAQRGQGADWLHTNGIDYEPDHDLIVLSTPRMNEVWVIDHSTTTDEAAGHSGGRFGHGGDLLYRWGNPRTYGAGTDADRQLGYQHNPTWLRGDTPGELRLLVFNNGSTPDDSSVDELLLPFDPKVGFQREPGAAFGPSEPAWSYSDSGNFQSSFISGAQRLPNGNTLICSGAPGRVFEVTPEGRIVWDYLNPHGGERPGTSQSGNAPPTSLFRATRIPADHPGLR